MVLVLSQNILQQQQQLSHLSQVFGVGYINQKGITPDQAPGSAGCILVVYMYTYWSHVYTYLGETIGNID